MWRRRINHRCGICTKSNTAHDYPNHYVEQQYLPYELTGKKYYEPSWNGYEAKIREHMKKLKNN